MAEKQKNFEASLKDLESIVRRLESGDLALEESLKLFEDGVKLSRECQERLNRAERRIEILTRDDEGNPSLETIKGEDLRGETSAAAASEPKVKRRIVFDTDDESPF